MIKLYIQNLRIPYDNYFSAQRKLAADWANLKIILIQELSEKLKDNRKEYVIFLVFIAR
jgi:hypothetical protein